MKRILALATLSLTLAAASFAQQCSTATPCSLFPTGTPSLSLLGHYELGVRFFSDIDGTMVGVRFYKPTTDTINIHTVNLWSTAGAKLGSATTTTETPSGWQSATFSTPIAIYATRQYIASYGETAAYSLTRNFFTSQINSAPLHAPAGTGNAPNGSYSNSVGTFPNFASANLDNHWIDVLFVAGAVNTSNPPPAPNIIIGTITINVSGTQPQHSVGLTWTETDPSVTGYNVLRSTTSGGGYVRINSAPVQTVTYTDAGVSGSTTYFYVVMALNSSGESANSNQVTSVVPAP
jgi:Domain of unknown function (DUF4082)